MRISNIFIVLLIFLLNSCVSKKEILYMQDVDKYDQKSIVYSQLLIQPNDILKITVGALIPETALPYNRISPKVVQQNSIEMMKLEGYLVSKESTIVFPGLGEISVENMSTSKLEAYLKERLRNDELLLDATVTIRILNSKVTILGEVNKPGTYDFTEERITLLQALGYANDLTIRGKRDDVLIIREADGIRQVKHLDLTSANWFDSPFYFIKPNDVIVVNQNSPKVSSAGYIGDVGTVLALTSVILSAVILITR